MPTLDQHGNRTKIGPLYLKKFPCNLEYKLMVERSENIFLGVEKKLKSFKRDSCDQYVLRLLCMWRRMS
jgi:hypothetical protein